MELGLLHWESARRMTFPISQAAEMRIAMSFFFFFLIIFIYKNPQFSSCLGTAKAFRFDAQSVPDEHL